MALKPFSDLIFKSAPLATNNFKISTLLYFAAYMAGVNPLDFSLTSAPSSFNFFTVSMSPLTMNIQKGLTVGFDFTNSETLELTTAVVAFKDEKEIPKASAVIMSVFFLNDAF